MIILAREPPRGDVEFDGTPASALRQVCVAVSLDFTMEEVDNIIAPARIALPGAAEEASFEGRAGRYNRAC